MKTQSIFWKFIYSPYFLALVALILSVYNLWDNKFNFKLEVAVGRQAKLWIGHIDNGKRNPVILMSLAFTNSGGKTEYLDDVKLKVTLTSNNRNLWEKEFISMREYDTFLGSASTINQVEILPIVIVGKTTEMRKYVFSPAQDIEQKEIPKSFDLAIKVYTKQRGDWRRQKAYEIKNISDVWQHLNQESDWRFNIKDIFEKK